MTDTSDGGLAQTARHALLSMAPLAIFAVEQLRGPTGFLLAGSLYALEAALLLAVKGRTVELRVFWSTVCLIAAGLFAASAAQQWASRYPDLRAGLLIESRSAEGLSYHVKLKNSGPVETDIMQVSQDVDGQSRGFVLSVNKRTLAVGDETTLPSTQWNRLELGKGITFSVVYTASNKRLRKKKFRFQAPKSFGVEVPPINVSDSATTSALMEDEEYRAMKPDFDQPVFAFAGGFKERKGDRWNGFAYIFDHKALIYRPDTSFVSFHAKQRGVWRVITRRLDRRESHVVFVAWDDHKAGFFLGVDGQGTLMDANSNEFAAKVPRVDPPIQ